MKFTALLVGCLLLLAATAVAPSRVARAQTTSATYSIQAIPAPPSARVIGLTDSGTVITDPGPNGCWVGGDTYLPCRQVVGVGNTSGSANANGYRLIFHPLWRGSLLDSLSVVSWSGTSIARAVLRLPAGLTCVPGFAEGFAEVLANGDVVATLVPRKHWLKMDAHERQYIWLRKNGSYSAPVHLVTAGLSDPYVIGSATVAYGHVLLFGRLGAPFSGPGTGEAFLWQPPLGPSPGSPPKIGISCFGCNGFLDRSPINFGGTTAHPFLSGFTQHSKPHHFFLAHLEVSPSGHVWSGPRTAFASLGRIYAPVVSSDQGANSVIMFARKIWMTRPGPSYIFENGRVSFLQDLIPPHSGWTYLGATVRNASGQIAGYGDYQGKSVVFLMTPAQ